MATVYHKNTILRKLREQISSTFFAEQTKPTQKHLSDLFLSILALNGIKSLKYSYDHFIRNISKFCLHTYYNTLNGSKIDLNIWLIAIIQAVMRLIPEDMSEQPIVLAVDDTMAEKFGEHFEHVTNLYDHSSHKDSKYIHGHCFVCLMMNVPVRDKRGNHYLSIPLGFRMWVSAEQSKLELAAHMINTAMGAIGNDRPVILTCDSWYPKGVLKDLIALDKFQNLTLVCNARSDTRIYDLPKNEEGQRGRPRVRGDVLKLEDFELQEIPGTDFCAGSKAVKTSGKMFGSRTVYAIVTKPKAGESLRLFLCTKAPEDISFDLSFADQKARAYAQTDLALLPMTIYQLRWDIEVSFFELKHFWSLDKYMLRSRVGIERLVNLISLVYSFMALLPHLSEDFAFLEGLSHQEACFEIGKLIREQVFLSTLVRRAKSAKNASYVLEFLNPLLFYPSALA